MLIQGSWLGDHGSVVHKLYGFFEFLSRIFRSITATDNGASHPEKNRLARKLDFVYRPKYILEIFCVFLGLILEVRSIGPFFSI